MTRIASTARQPSATLPSTPTAKMFGIAHAVNLRCGHECLFRSADFSNVLVPHISNPLFGNLSQWIGNGLIFGVCNSFPNPARGPRRWQVVSEHIRDRIHERTRVSLRVNVRG